MEGFSALMFIFVFCIFLAGLYIYTGHNSKILLWKGYNKDTGKEQLKVIGKWTMIISVVPIILGIVGLFVE